MSSCSHDSHASVTRAGPLSPPHGEHKNGVHAGPCSPHTDYTMAPSLDVLQPQSAFEKMEPSAAVEKPQTSWIAPREPLRVSGLLDSLYEFEELTPALGRLYPKVQLREIIHHEKADELLRDLAIIISRRGVVFFKSQELSPEEQKFFTDRLGHLTGKPPSSGLHIHPSFNADREVYLADGQRNRDNEISVIDSEVFNQLEIGPRSGADEWHSDISFEKVPADYTSLKVHTMPPTGGDTLWASGYEVYDLLSPHFQAMADSLVGKFASPEFTLSALRYGYKINTGPRGAADNVGEDLSAEHPFVRTNPVTGWKSVFGVGHHFSGIKDLKPNESDLIRKYVLDLVTQNHTTQLRYRWGKNDLAVWDNRSTYHAATPDYQGLGPRSGVRAVSCGERPYFDPNSRSRRAELGNSRLI